MLNIEDCPKTSPTALAHPPVAIGAVRRCRRLCVRDDFVWKEKPALRLGLSRASLRQARSVARGRLRRAPLRDAAVVRVRRARSSSTRWVSSSILASASCRRRDRARGRSTRSLEARCGRAAHGGAHRAAALAFLRERHDQSRHPRSLRRSSCCSSSCSRCAQIYVQARRGSADRGATRTTRATRFSTRPRAHSRHRRHRARAHDERRQRVYPLGPQLAQTVGYVSTRYGTSGIEDALRPRADAARTTAAIRSRSSRRSPRRCAADAVAAHGADVVTTIVPSDRKHSSVDLLSHYPRAAGVVLDPRNGAVLALASVPSYDPERLRRAILGADAPIRRARCSTARSTASIRRARRSRSSPRPRRSTADTVTHGFALRRPGLLAIGDFTLHDNESEATGDQDLTGAFALSSNVDFAQIALKLGVDHVLRLPASAGASASRSTSSCRPQPDRVPAQASIVPGELAQMGFGQGALLVTPLQMALLGATIADGGNEPRPYIVRQVVRDGDAATVSTPATLANPVSRRDGRERHGHDGRRRAARNRHAGAAAGRHGRRQDRDRDQSAGRSHAWFVAFAPAEHPRVAVAIVVENVGLRRDVRGADRARRCCARHCESVSRS